MPIDIYFDAMESPAHAMTQTVRLHFAQAQIYFWVVV
jgi:hypothetical protein